MLLQLHILLFLLPLLLGLGHHLYSPGTLHLMFLTTLGARASGNSIRIPMMASQARLNVKRLCVEDLYPPGNLPLWVLDVQQPPQRPVVSTHWKFLAVQVVTELLDKIDYCQQFSSSDAIAPLFLGKCPASISNPPLFTSLDLRKHSTIPKTTGVCIKYERPFWIWVGRQVSGSSINASSAPTKLRSPYLPMKILDPSQLTE